VLRTSPFAGATGFRVSSDPLTACASDRNGMPSRSVRDKKVALIESIMFLTLKAGRVGAHSIRITPDDDT
jgi:hypothetical protein